MIIKNPYRITDHIGVAELIPTATGVVTGLDWCKAEAKRFCSQGIPAKAVKRGEICYVVRNFAGCKVEPEDPDLIGATVASVRSGSGGEGRAS